MPGALPPPSLIETDAQLALLVETLASEPALAVDTESNSLFVYRERVCVLQVSTPQHDYVIDALKVTSLQPLAPLFANPRQQKIFHAAEYDLICLKRAGGFEFAALFDTMVAARTLGYPQTGLGALLEKYFAVTTNKKHQRANWGKRPLTAELLDYARMDTHYLFQLRDALLEALIAAGCLEEAHEEFARLARLKVEPFAADPNAFWRMTGARDLSPRQAAVLRELHLYREQQAQRADVPPFKVMGDATLMAVARRSPQAAAEFQGLPGMTERQIQRHGSGLLNAVQRGLKAAPLRPPRPALEPDEVRERYEKLRQWRKQKAQARGVESDVILPREALWEMARRAPASAHDLQQLEHLGPWRRATYGAELLRVLGNGTSNVKLEM
jgi:ribonuclease D